MREEEHSDDVDHHPTQGGNNYPVSELGLVESGQLFTPRIIADEYGSGDSELPPPVRSFSGETETLTVDGDSHETVEEVEAELIEQRTAEQIAKVLVQIASSGSASTWSGPMPNAEEQARFALLVPNAPERFFRIVESQTVDPSRRQDQMVNAVINEASAGRKSAVTLIVLFAIVSAIFFFTGRDIAGGVFLSIPVLAFLKTLLPSGLTQKPHREKAAE